MTTSQHRLRNPLSAALVLISASGAAAPAHAAWDTVPEITLSAENNDNVLLDVTQEQSASRTALDASIRLSNFNERGNVFIEPRVVTDAYSGSDTSQFESDDYFFNAGGNYDWRTVGAGFRSRYLQQSVLHSEFIDVSPDDPDDDFVDPDTGRLEFFSQERELFEVRGNLDFRISERNDFRIEARSQDVAYSGAQSSFRSDFDSNSLALAIVRRADERNTISAEMRVSEFNAELNDNTTDSVALEGNFTRELGPTWNLNLVAGVQRNEFSFLSQGITRIENADTSSIFGISLRRSGERTLWNLNYRHRVQPNGNGFLVIRDDISINANHDFSPRLSGRFGIRHTITDTIGGARAQDERDYTRAELRLEWALKETLFMFFGYDRTSQEFTNEGTDDAARNTFLVGITYRGRSRQN